MPKPITCPVDLIRHLRDTGLGMDKSNRLAQVVKANPTISVAGLIEAMPSVGLGQTTVERAKCAAEGKEPPKPQTTDSLDDLKKIRAEALSGQAEKDFEAELLKESQGKK